MTWNSRKAVAILLVNVACLALTLVLCESALRAIHAVRHWGEKPPSTSLHQSSSIPGLVYEMAPNREVVVEGIPMKTNQYGMRDTEPASEKAQSQCRIAVLGDSFTFGLGVLGEESYPKVLEERLRMSPELAGCQVEVLNFGVIGYSSYDEDLMLKYRVVKFSPHVVILGYVLNDPEIDPVQPLHAHFVADSWWKPFRILKLVAQVKASWEQKHLGGGDYYVYLHDRRVRKWQSVVDAFADIRDVASRRDIRVLVVIFPMVEPPFKGLPWEDYPYKAIHQQVKDLALRNGFRVLDLYDAFSHYPSQALVFPGPDNHPNPLGHEVTARAIEAALLANRAYFFDPAAKF